MAELLTIRVLLGQLNTIELMLMLFAYKKENKNRSTGMLTGVVI